MKLRTRVRRSGSGGFSLLETCIASSLFLIVGYVVVVSVDMGSRSQELVMSSAEENRNVRTAGTSLVDELQVSCDDQITVTDLPDGNTEVTLKVPIEVGGAQTWGTAAEEVNVVTGVENEAHDDWSIRYTVEAVGDDKQLVRQVLDDTLTVQSEEILVEELDTEDEPCFTVSKQGAMWVVSVATKHRATKLSEEGLAVKGRRSEFHVRTRN